MITPGMITVKKVDSNNQLENKSFPVVDVIPATFQFGLTGLQVTPSLYSWDFGDGNSSTKVSPFNTYSTYGCHNVIVMVKDRGPTWMCVESLDHRIVLGKMDIEGTPRSGGKPLAVNFYDLSIAPTGCNFTGMQWDFGDTFGATGMTEQTHIYFDYGSYNLKVDSFIDTI